MQILNVTVVAVLKLGRSLGELVGLKYESSLEFSQIFRLWYNHTWTFPCFFIIIFNYTDRLHSTPGRN